MKKTIFLAIALVLAGATFADRRNIKDHTEAWLQRGNAEETSGSLRTSRGLDDVPGTDTDPRFKATPIPNAFPLLILMAAGYGIVLNRKKQRDSKK
ncbi:hypothetical protein FACS189413_02310 [Bacteroidia bacterium]|nr:hypothetical protein FACS189413_02310 [Bacteroidia bacterium]